MSHEIDFSKGEPAIITRGTPAWHGLGKTVNVISPLEALKLGGLDYSVILKANTHKYPINPATGDPYFPPVVSRTSFFTFRDDTGGILGDKLGAYYKVLQNSEAVELIAPLCEMGLKIEVAGALFNGRTMFVTIAIGSYKVGGEDEVKTYLVFTNTHDGSRNIYAFFTDVRVVCWNTLHWAMIREGVENPKRKDFDKGIVKVRHTGDVKAKTEQAIEWLVMAGKHIEQAEKCFNRMLDRELTAEKFFDYAAGVMFTPAERNALRKGDPDAISTRKRGILDEFFEYARFGPGQSDYNKTFWGAYNAVTGFLGNVKQYKNDSTRAASLWFGESKKTAQQAFILADNPDKIEPLWKNVSEEMRWN